MKRFTKLITIMMLMVMIFTGVTPTVTEAKTTKTSIVVTNKSTGKKIGKKLTLTQGKKLQLKVKYGKTNVTKKAKYKASNKNVTVNKKGKITAKKAGATTVTIKYNKKTKKIKVAVKAKTMPSDTRETIQDASPSTEQSTEESSQQEKIDRYVEQTKSTVDLRPDCQHEWVYLSFISDVPLTLDRTFFDSYMDHLSLTEICCSKCGKSAITKEVPIKDALTYTNDELSNLIIYYRNTAPHTPKHTHQYIKKYTYSIRTNQWGSDDRCTICNCYRN